VPHLNLSTDTTQLIAVAGAGVAVLSLLVAFIAHLRFRRLRRTYAVLQGGDDGASLLSVVRRQAEDIARLRSEIGLAGRELGSARADLADAIRHVSVVRYDAFADMGGRLSFSAALLDDAGDGLVLTSINGRTETRSYAKGVKAGASEHTLSPEEEQAINFALRGSAEKALRGSGAKAARSAAAQPAEDVSIQL
jgi:hypothetical protein